MSLNPPSSSGSIGEGNCFPFAIVRGGEVCDSGPMIAHRAMSGIQHGAAISQPDGIVPGEVNYYVCDGINLRSVEYSEAPHIPTKEMVEPGKEEAGYQLSCPLS